MRALECSRCGRWGDNVSEEAKSVVCSYCVLRAIPIEEQIRKWGNLSSKQKLALNKMYKRFNKKVIKNESNS